jgi:hypothetical protein
MNIKSLLFFAVTIVFVPFISLAQAPKSFSSDASKYLSELQSFMEATNKKEGAEIMAAFSPVWSKFSSEMQQTIITTSNGMLQKRMKAFPDFKEYVRALMAFSNSNQTPGNFTAWHKSLEKMLEGKSRSYTNYVSTMGGLFKDNTLYSSASTQWMVSAADYTLDYDSLPKVNFTKIDLSSKARGDSITIYNTSGSFYPTSDIFYGNGGRVTWERAGIKPTDMFADLISYRINVTKGEYVSDSAMFHVKNNEYMNRPISGKVTDKIIAGTNSETINYPKFDSHDKAISIKNISKDVNYLGGFSVHGNKIVGSDGLLTFNWDDKPFMEIASRSFIIRHERISSENASVTMRFAGDSIFHPGIGMKYMSKERDLTLLFDETKSRGPFYNSYHNVDIYLEEMKWKIDDPVITMRMVTGAGANKLVIESSNMFSDPRFIRIQGLSTASPLFTIKQFAEKYSTRVVHAEDLAKKMRMNISEVKSLLLYLAGFGFVTYDSDEGKAVIKDKLYHYLGAKSGKVDYDVIALESVISGKPNASLSLLNFDLNTNGVGQVMLSDSKDVMFMPTEQELKMQKDRDMSFAGRIKAGRFDLHGDGFEFDYEEFKVDLDKVDSIRMKVPADNPDPDGRTRLIPVKSVLSDLTGDLKIDHPDNKSGIKSNDDYPIITSTKASYVYYDLPYIYEGVYVRDRFYFQLTPFTIDSLSSFTKEGLVFEGSMNSADIFPEFKETLRLQPDYSLGFVRDAPPGGFPAYKGKGKYHNAIMLSHEGYKGNGNIEYLAATIKSKEFVFFPDSARGLVNDFALRKGVHNGAEFPQAQGAEVLAQWIPYEDRMVVYQQKDPIDLFDKQATLAGNLILAPTGMTAQGMVAFGKADLQSNLFAFKQNSFGADTADFRLRADEAGNLSFATKNVNSQVDFTNRVGEFRSNGGGSYVTFPANQYICFIDEMKWFMDKEEIELTSEKKTSPTGEGGAEFVSIHPLQDSLKFFAPIANYSLRDNLLKADKVKEIKVADALIIPEDGKVLVDRGAQIRTLTNATIIADTTNQYHTIFNASVDIKGRKSYTGSGEYNYVDETEGKQAIILNSITTDDSARTVGKGVIYEKDDFSLSPKFKYKGNATLNAWKKNITFKGHAMLNNACEKLQSGWFALEAEVDPVSIKIPVGEGTKNESNEQLYAGLMLSDTAGVYPLFLATKKAPRDGEFFRVNGLLGYDRTLNQYIIAPTGEEEAGNKMVLDENRCLLRASGYFQMGHELGQVNMVSLGNLLHNLNNDSTHMDVTLLIDFYFTDDAFKAMNDNILMHPQLEPSDDNRQEYKTSLEQLLGPKKANDYLSELNLYGAVKRLPDELRSSMVFSNIKFNWNNTRNSFISSGPLSVALINRQQLGRKMNGLVEIQKKRTGDIINIYIAPSEQSWYFFSYTRGVMQAISSELAFNEAIKNMKPEKRNADVKDGKPYQFMLSTERRKVDFLRRINEADATADEN